MSSHPSPISSLKLRVTQGSNMYEQVIPSSSSETTNSFPITNQTFPELLNAFNSQPLGTIFNPSIVATYAPGTFATGDVLSTPSTPANFIPRQITPTFSVANIPDKTTADAPFYLGDFVTNTGTGVRGYSSSVPIVANVDSSSGLLTITRPGVTNITFSLAASADNIYRAATPITRTLTINNEFIDNSNYVAPFNNSNWQSYTTANHLPDFTMAARAASNQVVITEIAGVPKMARRLELTVHLPKSLGLDGGRWIIHYKFEKKVNGVWGQNNMPHVWGQYLGFENGELVWLTTNINTEVDPNPFQGVGISPGDILRCSASYNYVTSGDYNLDQPHQIKYSREFTYIG